MKGTRFVVLYDWTDLSMSYRSVSELPLDSPNAVLMYVNNWRNAVMQGKGNLNVKILDYDNFSLENQSCEISEAKLHQMIIKEDWKDKQL